MAEYLRETWDLHLGALFTFLVLGLILFSCGVVSLWAVPVIAVVGAAAFVLVGLWLLNIAGGSLPW